jgi:imidazolonepropionase-like amidohydrolase
VKAHEHTLNLDPASVYADRGEGFILTNANIIDVESGSLSEAQHLFIRDGEIAGIFTGSVPDSLLDVYQVIDAEGRYIMPAMIDMHAHLNSGGLIPPDAAIRLVALEQFARYGVGMIFTLGGHGFNQEITQDLIQKQQNREIIAPVIYATGDILTAPDGYPIRLLPLIVGVPADNIVLDEMGVLVIDEETDMDAIFSTKKEMGMKGIKVMVESGLGGGPAEPRLSNELVRNITAKAAGYGFPVFAHVSTQGDFEDAIDAGVDVLVHTVGDQVLTNSESYFEKMREGPIYYTPTLSIAYMAQFVASAEILDDPFMLQYSSERTNRSLRNWPIRQLMVKSMEVDTEVMQQNMLQNFTLFYESGVPILMGSDAGNASVIPGYSAHKELEFMAQQGMPVADVLRSATINPARFLGLEDSMGSLAEGKAASFILLDRNPLEDVRNSQSIHRVMLEGYWIE